MTENPTHQPGQSVQSNSEKPRTFKEKLTDNALILFAALAIASFGAGWTAHEKVTAVGGWSLITVQEKQEYNRLKESDALLKAKIADLEKQLGPSTVSNVTLLSPSEGEWVEWMPLVRGRLTGKLKNDEHLWIVVHPNDSRGWYPQNSELFPKADGSWETTVAIGREGKDQGKKLDIAVVVAKHTAHAAFNDYLKKAFETNHYPEIPLPDDIRMLGKVSVIRK